MVNAKSSSGIWTLYESCRCWWIRMRISAKVFDSLTDGSKRTLIFKIVRIKDVDKQVSIILDYFKEAAMKEGKKQK